MSYIVSLLALAVFVHVNQKSAVNGQIGAPPGPTKPRVLILGAGPAGLQAAQTLVDQGITDFLVLEGAGYYGGRVRDIPFAGAQVEVGADRALPLAEALESSAIGLLRTHRPNWESMDVYDGSGRNLNQAAQPVWNEAGRAVRNGLNLAEELWESHDTDMSVRAAYRTIGWLPTTPLEKTIEWAYNDYWLGDRPSYASLMSHAFDAPEWVKRGAGARKPAYITDQRGFKHFFEANMLFLQNPMHKAKILLNKNVTQINNNPLDIQVKCADGSVYSADYAISTFSVGVLQNNVVKFVPELPGWKVREYNRFTMGAHTKILMRFPTKFWGNKEFILRATDRKGHYPLFTDLGSKGIYSRNVNVLMAEITGDEARRIDKQPQNVIKNEIMAVLREMFGPRTPNPTDFYITDWNSNPLTMGARCVWGPALSTKCFQRIQSKVGRVLFAGEHTSLQFSSHVQGALESGAREANKAVQCMNGGACTEWVEGHQCACTGNAPAFSKNSASSSRVTSACVLTAIVFALTTFFSI
ncbi:polyamine oxidase 7-like [Anneissia japonica]|uniref:polyamine oxidase 7-like n=1 Tax=Anneissia japonica TaxID=1529436 RepID=UPI001425846C|nr:polyamine oxidase 7-like [Anneissia japonica]